VEPYLFYSAMNEHATLPQIRLLAHALDTLELTEDGRIGSISVSKEIIANADATLDDLRNYSFYPRSIKSVEIALAFVEYEDYIDVSFRSKGTVKVNEIARQFGGGGHPNAAGAELRNKSHDQVVKEVIVACRKALS